MEKPSNGKSPSGNGHVDIANEIMEAIAKTRLSSYESQIIHALWRKTYGWHKKADHISYTQWEELTGIKRWHIARTLKHLLARKIITQTGNGHHIEYAFQKDYSLWQSLPHGVTVRKSLPRGEGSLPQRVTKSLPQQVNTKETKETIQKKEDNILRRKLFRPHILTPKEKEEALNLLPQEGDRDILSVLLDVPGHWGKTPGEVAAEYSLFEETLGKDWSYQVELNEVHKFRFHWKDRGLKMGWVALRNWFGRIKR